MEDISYLNHCSNNKIYT